VDKYLETINRSEMLGLIQLEVDGLVPDLSESGHEREPLCLSDGCFADANDYAVYPGKFMGVAQHVPFGVAPLCDAHFQRPEINEDDVSRWMRHNFGADWNG